VKFTRITGLFAAAATAGLIAAPVALAEGESSAVHSVTLGSQGKLVDGNVIQGWTITDLKPSSDTIPYPVYGTLWEATATDEAIQGSVTPIISNLNARAADGTNYRVLFGAATPQGVNPATLAEGQQTTGKIYFDVTGPDPDRVVYNAGGLDLLVWTEPPAPAPSSAPSYRSYPAQTPATPAPTTSTESTEAAEGAEATDAEATEAEGAEATDAEATDAEATEATPATTSTEAPEGSTGTPIEEGSSGTPIEEGTAAPAGSSGTPIPAGDEVPTPVTYTPAPTP